MSTPDDRAELVRGLRELADWYEQHPEVPALRHATFLHGASAEVVTDAAKALGVEVTVSSAGHLNAERTFGPIEFNVYHIPAEARAEHDARNSYTSVIQVDATGGAR